VAAIYGGRAYEPQVEQLKKGVDVIVGTPGRLLDLAGQKKLNLKHVRSLVLDEADEMLDLGFLPDVEKIMAMLPVRRQTMLFSATMPGAVIGLARRYMSQPTHIRATAPDDEGATVRNTTQHVFRAHSLDKVELVSRVLQAEGRGLAMIFCRTKRTAADVAEQLEKRGFASGAVHGDLGQGAREQALRAFRNGKVDVLVCTDVAARGIDVEGVTHVINYQTPEDEKTYLHRIGRTGRAGASGIALTLVDWDDIPRWQLINKALDLPFPDPEETYSTSAHLYELLRIPEGTKGVLPRAERTRAGLGAEEVEDLGETGGRGARGARGSRDGGRDGGRRKAGSGPAATEAAPEERPARTRTPRQRRRTRGGSTLQDAATTPQTAAETAAADTVVAGTEEALRPAPRRRRRTRTAGASADAVTAVAVDEATAVSAPAAVVETAEPAAPVEAAPAAKTPRRRTRKAVATTDAVTETVTEAATVPAPADAAEADAPAAKTPRRRTRKAVATTDAVTGTVTEAATVPAPADAAEADAPAAKTPRRRAPRKTAATVPAPADAVDAVEAEPAVAKAPRRRAPRKAAVTAEATD
jgi:superfamily II DNA/RNA helicase